MVANIAQIFSKVGHAGIWCSLTAANTATDGTGTVGTIITADATNGSRIEAINIQPLGTNVATKIMFFLNNGLTNATAANNALIGEVTQLATTTSITVAIPSTVWVPPNGPLILPPGYKINIAIATAVAAGIMFTALQAGDY